MRFGRRGICGGKEVRLRKGIGPANQGQLRNETENTIDETATDQTDTEQSRRYDAAAARIIYGRCRGMVEGE